MPTYEYECTSCGRHIEVFQRFTEDPLTTCEACGGRLRKVFHPAGIVFKGSGFYATDSRKSSGASGSGDRSDKGDKGDAGDRKDTKDTKKADGSSTEGGETSASKGDGASTASSASTKDPS